ncbi:MAG: methyltransferase [Alphaproteobacteria bacterium PA2]|nr:MAG: methyltransferase [Alphaproteobacteria bacterium PA2]
MGRILLYGRPAPGLIEIPPGAEQVSPLVPGSADLADLEAGEAGSALILAPPGTQERAYVIAQALRAVKAGGELTVFAPKDKGGSRLRKALEAFGCEVFEDARRHHRFCQVERPETLIGLDAALAAGAPRRLDDTGLWTQPGVFSWDRLDRGTELLLKTLPDLKGRGADLGAGIGLLALKVLAGEGVSELTLVELDRRAVRAAEHNLDDPRVKVVWGDVRQLEGQLTGLDFVVMNPPFHDGGQEDRALGQAFIRAAAGMLRKGGVCWLTANRHLPYEAVLQETFRRVDLRAEDGGYKIYEAQA